MHSLLSGLKSSHGDHRCKYRIPMWIFDCVTDNVMYVSFINLLKAGRKGMRIFRVKLPLSFGEGLGGKSNAGLNKPF